MGTKDSRRASDISGMDRLNFPAKVARDRKPWVFNSLATAVQL
jgi:hypothetical protein